jgi:molybdate-binding protein
MTRYLEIAAKLARLVRDGELAVGAELPAVRAYAGEWGTTSSTVTRAYRHLADAGVITVADRRRARVAVDGGVAAARLLDLDRVFRLAGSDDPALQVLLDRTAPAVVPVGVRGSFPALRALARGDADGAAIHLRHHTGVYNGPFARALLRGREPRLLHLWRREQGLLVPRGNPKGIRSAADLAGVLVARREPGAGTRVLLEQLLIDAGIAPHTVPGPELGSHLETGLAVAAGIAGAAVGLRATAASLGLDFVSLVWESFDIVLGGSAVGAVAPIMTAVRDPATRDVLAQHAGYDLTGAGTVSTLDD